MDKIISVNTSIIDNKRKIVREVIENGAKHTYCEDYSQELFSKYIKEYVEQYNKIDIIKEEITKPEVKQPEVQEVIKEEPIKKVEEPKKVEPVKETRIEEVKPVQKVQELEEDIDINNYFIIKHKKAILRLVKTGLIIYGAYKIFQPMYADFKSMPNHVIIDEEKPVPQAYDVQEYYYNLTEEEPKVRQ